MSKKDFVNNSDDHLNNLPTNKLLEVYKITCQYNLNVEIVAFAKIGKKHGHVKIRFKIYAQRMV